MMVFWKFLLSLVIFELLLLELGEEKVIVCKKWLAADILLTFESQLGLNEQWILFPS